jgi:DNA end-binding protein Ku
MAPRPVWKGYLRLSLVSCAVELSNATDHSEKVSFRMLNRKTGNTVRRQYVDGVSGKPVPDSDEVKGYEIGKDEYLLVEDAEIDAVQIESSHMLNIESFVDRASIAQIYFDTPYYLSPADKVSEEAFAVLREAMARKKMAGIARIVLYRRERPAMIEPFGKGLLLTTLRYDNNVRKPEGLFDGEMINLASHIIDQNKAKFDPSKFEDRYENALLELIRAKQAGRKPPTAHSVEKPSNVVNLFDALKKSLAADGGKQRAAPATRKAAASRAKRHPAKSRKSA